MAKAVKKPNPFSKKEAKDATDGKPKKGGGKSPKGK